MKKRILQIFLLAAVILFSGCFLPRPCVFADTDGSEIIVVQPEKLEIQLGMDWIGAEFQLRTDQGLYPDFISVLLLLSKCKEACAQALGTSEELPESYSIRWMEKPLRTHCDVSNDAGLVDNRRKAPYRLQSHGSGSDHSRSVALFALGRIPVLFFWRFRL